MTISQADVDALFAETSATVSPATEASPADQGAAVPVVSPPPIPRKAEVERILKVSVPVAVLLAQRYMPIGTILETTVGTIIEFDVTFDSELTLQVGGRAIGIGQAVKTGENFGLRISRIGAVEDRIDAMGGE